MPGRPLSAQALQAAGLRAVALNGQKGYHGVARGLAPAVRILRHARDFCGKTDCRHVAAVLGEQAGLRDPITVQISTSRPAATMPDPRDQSEIRPQARVPRRDARARDAAAGAVRARHPGRRSQRRAARARCLEPQADAGVVSHTPIECEKLIGVRRRPAAGSTRCAAACRSRPSSTRGGATARADWETADKRPPARPHLGGAGARRPGRRHDGRARACAAARGRPTTCR